MKKTILILSLFVLGLISQSCIVKPRPVRYNATKVVVVKKAPKNHKIVVVKGKRYYYWNGNHYRKTSKGYVYVRI